MRETIAYSVKDAVSASGIGRTKLYELIKAGDLPTSKIGSRTLIRRTDLEVLLARHVNVRS
jgi:excisionase family DNA binding protein